MKIMFLALPIVYTVANVYLFIRVLQAISGLPLWGKIIISILFWVVAFALFASIALRETHLPDPLLRTLFKMGSIWMGFLLYSVMLLAVADIIKMAIPTMNHTFWYVFPVTCMLLVCGYINYRNPKVEHFEIDLERYASKENMRIVAISDVHLGYGTGIKALERYVKQINAQHPDLVLIVGDLIDNSIKPLLSEPIDKVLATIDAPLGIYMVPGNHEHISGIDMVSDYLEKTPIILLRDSIATLPNGVQIMGRDDRTNQHRKSLDDLLSQVSTQHPTIVLDHQPYDVAEADALNVDLMLCGHTHRGQMFPLNLLTDCLYQQSHGYRKWNNSHIWVSSGISLWGPPFRIGTKSDLAVIDIKRYCE